MLEAVERIFGAIMPLMVTIITVYGTVLVAKVNKVQKSTKETDAKVSQVQKDIITNHGSKNLGDAIDRLTTKVQIISDNQDDLIETVKGMQARDTALEARMGLLERVRVPRPSSSPHTGPIPIKFIKRRKK